ncbi:unnamed protein product [Miscanthus lutarioriparius]|uniref:Uncharacterized protein n=1 Tax=Miscanthus lutarioriparius TaxID=422564 RepID=A0A811QBM9_9POAL|nr:unnamed protein product [Miscanthus lutarioriparius]
MVDNNGRNTFHVSVTSAMENALRCLICLVRPAELLNRININGHTPLHLAAKINHVERELLLLNDRRVDPYVHDGDRLMARCLVEKWMRTGMTDTYQMHFWNQLKQKESKMGKG